MCILVFPGPAKFMLNNGLDMASHDEDPEEEQDGTHACANKLDTAALESLSDLNCRDGEAHIREYISVPVQMEVVSLNRLN